MLNCIKNVVQLSAAVERPEPLRITNFIFSGNIATVKIHKFHPQWKDRNHYDSQASPAVERPEPLRFTNFIRSGKTGTIKIHKLHPQWKDRNH